MQPSETVRTIEVIASNDSALLPFLLDQLTIGSARPELLDIARPWSVTLTDLHKVTATRAARDLDHLQRRGVR